MKKVHTGGRLEAWKKAVLIAIALIAVLRAAYIWFGGEVDKEYQLSFWFDLAQTEELPCRDLTEDFTANRDRLHSVELCFTGIAPEESGHVELAVRSGEEVFYEAKLSLSEFANREWKPVYIGLELTRGREYQLSLNAGEDCMQIPNIFVTAPDSVPAGVNSAQQGGRQLEGALAVGFGYHVFPGRLERLVVSALWLGGLGLLALAVLCWERVTACFIRAGAWLARWTDPKYLCLAAELSACHIFLTCSGIEFQEPTKLIFYLLSLCVLIKREDRLSFIRDLCGTPGRKALLAALCVYGAFALAGQRLLVYPLDKSVTIVELFVFGATALWVLPVVQWVLYGFHLLGRAGFSGKAKRKTPLFCGVALALLLIPAALHLYACNPGISSADTYDCMVENAHNLYGMTDWHPAFYCIVLGAILRVWDSTYAVIFLQWALWGYVMLDLLLYLRKKGMREELLWGTALLTGAASGNFVNLNTIWKDIPFALCMLLALVCTAKLTIDRKLYRKKILVYLELTAALVAIFLLRKNGVVDFLVIGAALAVALRKNVRVWGALAASVALILVVKGPLYNHFQVEDVGRKGIYIGLGQDILGVYYAGGEVSPEVIKMVNELTDGNIAEFRYTPTYSRASYRMDVEPVEFIGGYLETFVRNPVLMLRAVIDREDAMWDVFAGEDSRMGCVDYNGVQDGLGQWNQFYPARRYNSLYPKMRSATAYTVSSQWLCAIQWRGGLAMLLGVCACIFLALKRGKGAYWAMAAPIAGHILSLLLSTGWSDFRYFWPLNLMYMAFCLLALAAVKQEKEEPKERERS